MTFPVKGVPGDPTFKGTLSKDARTLAGDFTQGPAVGHLHARVEGGNPRRRRKTPPVGKEFEGAWEGSLDVNGMTCG